MALATQSHIKHRQTPDSSSLMSYETRISFAAVVSVPVFNHDSAEHDDDLRFTSAGLRDTEIVDAVPGIMRMGRN